MGCVTSKQAVSVTPAVDHSGVFRDNAAVGSGRSLGGNGNDVVAELEKSKSKSKSKKKNKRSESGLSGTGSELGDSGRASSTTGGGGDSVSFRLGNLLKYVEAEQVAAGWPAWLSAVAGEAIHGWVPLRAESYEKLEKVHFRFHTHTHYVFPN